MQSAATRLSAFASFIYLISRQSGLPILMIFLADNKNTGERGSYLPRRDDACLYDDLA